MLSRCIEQVYGEINSKSSYYLADSSGIDITGGDTEYLRIDDDAMGGGREFHGQLKHSKSQEKLPQKLVSTVLKLKVVVDAVFVVVCSS